MLRYLATQAVLLATSSLFARSDYPWPSELSEQTQKFGLLVEDSVADASAQQGLVWMVFPDLGSGFYSSLNWRSDCYLNSNCWVSAQDSMAHFL